MPRGIDERACFDAIDARKDVDGVTCLGFGRMGMGESAYGSCTPAGIMSLLNRINKTGTTVLVATHDREMVDSMRKRVIALEEGRIIRDQSRGVYGYGD